MTERAKRKPRRKAEPVTIVQRPHPGLWAAAMAAAEGDAGRITIVRPGYLEVDRSGLGSMWAPDHDQPKPRERAKDHDSADA
jgi:hypothetical protein